MIEVPQSLLRNIFQGSLTIALIIYAYVGGNDLWVVRLIILSALLMLQIIIGLQKKLSKYNTIAIQSLIGLGQIILSTEEDISFKPQIIFCSIETREVVIMIILFKLKWKNLSELNILNSNHLYMIGVLLSSQIYFLIRIGTQEEVALFQILTYSLIFAIRLIIIALSFKGGETDSDDKQTTLETNFNLKMPSEHQIGSARSDYPKHLIRDRTQTVDRFTKKKQQNEFKIIKSLKSNEFQEDVSFTAYQKLLNILPEGVILVQNVDDRGMPTTDRRFQISYSNQTISKMFNVENNLDLFTSLASKRDFEQVKNSKWDNKRAKIPSLFKSSQAYNKMKSFQSQGFIHYDNRRSLRIGSSQRAIQREAYLQNQNNMQQSNPDLVYDDYVLVTFGDHINKFWEHLVYQEQQNQINSNMDLFGTFMLKTPNKNPPLFVSMNHDDKSLIDMTSSINKKIENLNIEVSVYGTVINNLLTLILLCRDVTHRSYIDILNLQNKNKSKTISYVSHEFRTPLSCMIQLLQASLDYPQGSIAYIKSTLVNAKHLLGLSNDLLDLAQIKVGKFQINKETFNLREIIEECIDMFQILAEQKSLKLFSTIDKDVPIQMMSDVKRTKQIIINLIGNAFKFTMKGQIQVIVTLQSQLIMTIRVTDTGIGIREQDKSKLFHAFGKLTEQEGKQLNAQGVGLGLYISNQIARLIGPHCGEVGLQFESEFRKGSSFYFQIFDLTYDIEENDIKYVNSLRHNEIKSSSDEQGCGSPSIRLNDKYMEGCYTNVTRRPLQTKSILTFKQIESHDYCDNIDERSYEVNCQCNDVLIVDDNQFNVEMLKLILSKCKVTKVDFTISGIIAEQIVREKYLKKCESSRCNQYRIIFMDIEMPLQDGFTTIINMNDFFLDQKFDRHTRIIGCSGYCSTKEQNKCLDLGASDYLVKPIVLKELNRVLDLYYRN